MFNERAGTMVASFQFGVGRYQLIGVASTAKWEKFGVDRQPGSVAVVWGWWVVGFVDSYEVYVDAVKTALRKGAASLSSGDFDFDCELAADPTKKTLPS